MNVKSLKAAYLSYYPRVKGYASFAFVFFILNAFATIYAPSLIKRFVDNFQMEQVAASDLAYLALALVCIQLVGFFASIIAHTSLRNIDETTDILMQNDFFQHFMKVKPAFVSRFGVGDVSSRLAQTGTVSQFLSNSLLCSMAFLFLGGYAVYSMIQIHLALTCAVLLGSSISYFVLIKLRPALLENSKNLQRMQGKLHSKIAELFYNRHELHLGMIKQNCLNSTNKENNRYHVELDRKAVLNGILAPYMSLINNLHFIIILVYGGALIISDTISLGELSAFFAYALSLLMPINELVIITAGRERLRAAFIRLNPLSSLETEKGSFETSFKSVVSAGSSCIKLDQVSFSYNKTSPIIQDLSCTIKQGECVVIVGEVGAGKSTLLELLIRFQEFQSGSYQLWGQEVFSLAPAHIRAHIGWVGQNHEFFSASIHDNLVMGLEESSLQLSKRLIKATTDACIYDEIMNFSDQFNTKVGESGIKLSGGQKQRLALARALLYPRQIYLFDNIFSSLDYQTSAQIAETLTSLKKQNITLLLTSHRPIENICDRVLTLKDGRLTDA
ncbi:MAG: ABC transporter ATP-binding protein [Proteobacteria bacterium]|nr:ABC transporter ATP-binding protein [Pseudomonadota bacterium]